MSKHVSLKSRRPLSVSYLYCVDGNEVSFGGAYIKNLEKVSYRKADALLGTSFSDFEIAIANLQYLLRLTQVLRLIDLRHRGDDHRPLTRDERGRYANRAALAGRAFALYLGKRPYPCCKFTSSGGTARRKNDAS